MRFKEFSSEENTIRYVKFAFQKTLNALVTGHKKRLKIHKNKVKIAKQDKKNKHIQSLKNTSAINVNAPERPKRIKTG